MPLPINTFLLREIATAIEKNPESYDQSLFGLGERPTCDSPACIAGWAVTLAGYEPEDLDGSGYQVRAMAQDALNLTNKEAKLLFAYPLWKAVYDFANISMPSIFLTVEEQAQDVAYILREIAERPASFRSAVSKISN